MKNAASDLLHYTHRIGSKWIFWLFTTIDLIAVIAQVVYPSFNLPESVFLLIILVGFFWAGYQVYRDIAEQLPSKPIKPPPYELLPLAFRIELHQEIPQIELWFYAVNHQSKELVLQSLTVTNFHLSGCPGLESISLSREIRIPPKQSQQVLCRRHLIEAEVRVIERTERRNPKNATFSVASRSLAGRKQLHFQNDTLSVNGWVSGTQNSS